MPKAFAKILVLIVANFEQAAFNTKGVTVIVIDLMVVELYGPVLDIPAIEVLEETLDEFVGTVFVISHDRYFLDKVVDNIVELRNGQLTSFIGGYTDYLEATAHGEKSND